MTVLRRCCCYSVRIIKSHEFLNKYAAIPLRFLDYGLSPRRAWNKTLTSQGYSTTSCCSSFFNQSAFTDKTKEYNGRKLVGFSMDEMYQVVSDVENYKNFVPFCKRSEVTERKPGFLKGQLSIGFPPISESYVSAVTLIRPRLVKAECTEGHLFDHLTTVWKFSPGLSSEPQSCVIDFYVSFSFRSALHSQLAHVFFNELVRQMERAFFSEAERRFGKPSIHTLKLDVKNKSQQNRK